MKFLSHILVVCVFVAATVLNGTNAAADDLQKAKLAYDKGNPAAAIKLLLLMAKSGNPEAQILLGRIYSLPGGWPGVKRDRTKAQFWLEKAVKQNYTPAFRALGFHLVGTGKNPFRGYRLLKTAAERGDAKAQWGLGLYLMSSNWGLPEDRAAARKWLLKSIEQKHVNAAFELLKWYRGEGDYTEAHKWDLIVQYLWKSDSTLLHPDIREKMTKTQIAESQRRAKAWLKAHGENP